MEGAYFQRKRPWARTDSRGSQLSKQNALEYKVLRPVGLKNEHNQLVVNLVTHQSILVEKLWILGPNQVLAQVIEPQRGLVPLTTREGEPLITQVDGGAGPVPVERLAAPKPNETVPPYPAVRNKQNLWGYTPLHRSTSNGRQSRVRLKVMASSPYNSQPNLPMLRGGDAQRHVYRGPPQQTLKPARTPSRQNSLMQSKIGLYQTAYNDPDYHNQVKKIATKLLSNFSSRNQTHVMQSSIAQPQLGNVIKQGSGDFSATRVRSQTLPQRRLVGVSAGSVRPKSASVPGSTLRKAEQPPLERRKTLVERFLDVFRNDKESEISQERVDWGSQQQKKQRNSSSSESKMIIERCKQNKNGQSTEAEEQPVSKPKQAMRGQRRQDSLDMGKKWRWDPERWKLVSALCHALEYMCFVSAYRQQGKKLERLTKFHANSIPQIPLAAFVKRIAWFSECSNACFVLSLEYIHRLRIRKPEVKVNAHVAHQLLITCIMVSAKFFDDKFFNNTFYARLGGLPVAVISGLEMQLLFFLNFDLHVLPDQYKARYVSMVQDNQGLATVDIGPQGHWKSAVGADISKMKLPVGTISTEINSSSTDESESDESTTCNWPDEDNESAEGDTERDGEELVKAKLKENDPRKESEDWKTVESSADDYQYRKRKSRLLSHNEKGRKMLERAGSGRSYGLVKGVGNCGPDRTSIQDQNDKIHVNQNYCK